MADITPTAKKRIHVAAPVRFGLSVEVQFEEVTHQVVEEQVVLISGLTTEMVVLVNKPTADANIHLVSARVSANGKLAVKLFNDHSSSDLTPAKQYITVLAF